MTSCNFDEIKKKTNKTGKLAFDIETTGKKKDDKFVAVGYAWKQRDGTVVNGHYALKVLNEDEDPGEAWQREGFEMRCFNEFWSKPEQLEKLKKLQQGDNVVGTVEELAACVNEVLKAAEEHWEGNLQIITNTTAYDTCWLHQLLVHHNFHALDATREGKHRWTYDVDSFMLGALGETPDTVNWRDLSAFVRLLKTLPVDDAPHDHHPANDAKSILATFDATELYQGMVEITALDVISASNEDYEEALETHLDQVRKRFSRLRRRRF